MDFRLNCDTPGFTASVTQYYFGVSGDYTVRKYHPTNGFFTITNASISDQAIGGQQVKVAAYQVLDGGPLDIDGQSNGVIEDPAGLGMVAQNLASTGHNVTQITTIAVAFLLTAVTSITVLIARKKYQPSM